MFFCLPIAILLVKFGGVKLPSWDQFYNQHELAMGNDPWSLTLVPFPLIAEDLVLDLVLGEILIPLRSKIPQTIEVDETEVP